MELQPHGVHDGSRRGRSLVLCVCLAACLVEAASGKTLEASSRASSAQTPRYENRYSKAKAGINAEESAMRLRLQNEINSEDARLKKIAYVLSRKPAVIHGARLPEAIAKTVEPTTARDFKTPPAKTTTKSRLAAAAAHQAKASKMKRALARISAKRSHMRQNLDKEAHKTETGSAYRVGYKAATTRGQLRKEHLGAKQAQKGVAARYTEPMAGRGERKCARMLVVICTLHARLFAARLAKTRQIGHTCHVVVGAEYLLGSIQWMGTVLSQTVRSAVF